MHGARKIQNRRIHWIAGGLLVALAVVLVIRVALVAIAVRGMYPRLLITAFTSILAVNFTWNILMNLGLAPIGGLGLPLISFGGSQLIFNAAALGIVSSIYRRRTLPAGGYSGTACK